MHIPVFHVDFNEMVDEQTVLFSKHDQRMDIAGVWHSVLEGMPVRLMMEDANADGERDDLLAEGVVIKNHFSDWSAHVKWCCRINDRGVRSRSEMAD